MKRKAIGGILVIAVLLATTIVATIPLAAADYWWSGKSKETMISNGDAVIKVKVTKDLWSGNAYVVVEDVTTGKQINSFEVPKDEIEYIESIKGLEGEGMDTILAMTVATTKVAIGVPLTFGCIGMILDNAAAIGAVDDVAVPILCSTGPKWTIEGCIGLWNSLTRWNQNDDVDDVLEPKIDINDDGIIDDYELIVLIDLWSTGKINDFVLLDAIDEWSRS